MYVSRTGSHWEGLPWFPREPKGDCSHRKHRCKVCTDSITLLSFKTPYLQSCCADRVCLCLDLVRHPLFGYSGMILPPLSGNPVWEARSYFVYSCSPDWHETSKTASEETLCWWLSIWVFFEIRDQFLQVVFWVFLSWVSGTCLEGSSLWKMGNTCCFPKWVRFPL